MAERNEAREALPYWLQRVRELEAQVQDLKERAEAAEEAAVDYARRLDQSHKENEELRGRVRELEQCLQDELWYQEDREKAATDLVKQLEAENVRLEQRVQGLENGLLYQAEVATRLEAENRRLKAVAEAAKLAVDE